jgi:hypothetical protein
MPTKQLLMEPVMAALGREQPYAVLSGGRAVLAC